MNAKPVEVLRTVLTVVGILLLVIFGSRAAAQARNMKLAGATHKSILGISPDILSVLGIGTAERQVALYQPRPIAADLPAQISQATPVSYTASPQATTTPQPSAVQNANPDAASTTNKGLRKATGTVNKTVNGLTNALTRNTSNDFTDLWP